MQGCDGSRSGGLASVTVLDGGMGKELRRIGAPFRQPEWSALALLEAPERVVEAHRNFVDAGAEVIITNNYAVVPYHLGDERFAQLGRELTALAGQLARSVADTAAHPVRVAGSLPPVFGSYLADRVDRGRAVPIYRSIVAELDPFVDLWVGETLSSVDEMHAVLDGLEAVPGDDRPVWVAFSLPEDLDAGVIALRSGETIAELVAAIVERGRPIEAVLFNCSLPELTGPAIRELRASSDRAGLEIEVGGYANALPTTRDDTYTANSVIFERRDEITADHYADVVQGWIDLGATIVGGCCDMYPDHIAALAARFSAGSVAERS